MEVFTKIVMVEKIYFKVKIFKCSPCFKDGFDFWYSIKELIEENNVKKIYKVKQLNDFKESICFGLVSFYKETGFYEASDFYIIKEDISEDLKEGFIVLKEDCIKY